MRSITAAITILTTLAAGQTLIVYSDDACTDQIATYSSSNGDSNQCQSIVSGVQSYEIANDATGCAASRAYTELVTYSSSDCSGNALSGTCYQACTSVVGVDGGLQAWLWDTYSEPVDPPRS